ncbi:MAG: magnesium chelatase subunit H [Pseudomonadota bacterium]
MQKHISDAERTPLRVVVVTLDHHLASTAARAQRDLRAEIPQLELSLHATALWENDPDGRERCIADIERAHIIIVSMLFMDEHIRAVMPALQARRDACDCLVSFMSGGDVIKLSHLGGLDFGREATGIMGLIKRLKGAKPKTGQSSGEKQMAMLRRIPRLLRFVPGSAQDLRAYFITMQYWLAGSEENFANMVRFLVTRYAQGPRAHLRECVEAAPPVTYPETGVYHPAMTPPLRESVDDLPVAPAGCAKGRIGLLLMRSYLLARNTRHYDAVIAAFEAKGYDVVPAFACGLDARPAVERFFKADGKPTIDALVSLTGFSLVGGPAYNDTAAAAQTLIGLDVPYIAAHAVEFQSLSEWDASARGLLPVEATMMVAIPELDGATGSMLFGGREHAGEAHRVPQVGSGRAGGRAVHGFDMKAHGERVAMLAARVDRFIKLRHTPRAERRLSIVLFNFPPNGGAVGTAAFLSVWESLFNTLQGLKASGYTVDVPPSVDALRDRVLEGNARDKGAGANVHALVSANDHVARETHLAEIEAQWGPAPGKHQTEAGGIQVLGVRLGNIFIGIQPAFGYEGDPMRLLFERDFAPTHAFAAFYRYLKEDFAAHAVLHFGTHGALEFMPGKQTALSAACWPDRLIGALPNVYLYAANNPSEGMIAKRRAAATLVSYLTPAITQAGLYKGLCDLKAALERWRGLPAAADPKAAPMAGPRDAALADAKADDDERAHLAPLIQAQAAAFDLAPLEPIWTPADAPAIDALHAAVVELEHTLIPDGLHVLGAPMDAPARTDMLEAICEAETALAPERRVPRAAIETLVATGQVQEAAAHLAAHDVAGASPTDLEAAHATLATLADTNAKLAVNGEVEALIHALDGRFVPPSSSGDLIRTPAILPTGRNIHGFDPYKIPSAFAARDGAAQAARLIARHQDEHGTLPETIALVLWGTDNLKSEGGPIAQVLALLGARARFDPYGRLAGAELIPLAELERPRIDVVVTLSGIFRDLLPLQTRLLAEAAYLAATAAEPHDKNFVRKHAVAYAETHGCDLETAALRVFSNADGAYGSNVNQLITDSAWEDEDELADIFESRKSFAYGRDGKPAHQPAVMSAVLAQIDLAYQNLESVELGVTTIDHYFDTLGGIAKAAERAQGRGVAVYIGDQTRGSGQVRTLNEQVALETRTRALNPKWYEGMLKHGYEGVRQIEATVTNTMGWSATTAQVAPWVYQQITQTYVLDPAMRARLAKLNPAASAKLANRLIEAEARNYWQPDEATLAALREAGDELEDHLEGISSEALA